MTLQRIKTDAETFVELLTKSADDLVEAGKFAVAALERDPEFIDKVCDKCPDITDETVRRFIALGQKRLHPSMLFSEAPGIRRLRRLPYALQEQYNASPVEMQIRSESGWETLRVDVRNLTPAQAAQVFDCDSVRSPAAQRAYLEDVSAQKGVPASRSDLPYRVTGRGLVVLNPCTLTRKELARVLADME